MPVPQKILDLIGLFERNADDYRALTFNEANTRQQFINPFFNCFGWDMDNEQGYAEAYKEVIHEDAIKIQGATKAPDYCFRIGGTRKFFLIGGTRKFFLEAKKQRWKIGHCRDAAAAQNN